MNLSLTEVQIFTALRSFLLDVLPAGTPVFKAQTNRVPEPHESDFVSMTPILRKRLETNVDSYDSAQDVQVLTFAALTTVPIVGDTVVNGSATASGVVTAVTTTDVTVNTLTAQYFAVGDVVSNTTHAGVVGTMTGLAYGSATSMQPIEMTIQLDVHGPLSGDNAQIVSTLLRDAYGVDQFATSGFDVTPLYTSDPKQIPFVNGEQQVETRWVVDVALQCNPVVTIPQQYGQTATVAVQPPLQ
jgi:hypothetical protein